MVDREIRGRTVYTVAVTGDGRLRTVDGRFYKRFGRTTLLMGAEEIGARLSAQARDLTPAGEPPRDEWLERHRAAARQALAQVGLTACFEVLLGPEPRLTPNPQQLLIRHAEASMIHTWGWPMGIVLNDERRPRPTADGIVAFVPASEKDGQRSFDYWALRSDGTFYTLRSYFEDERADPRSILYFNTRIVNIAEAFLYATCTGSLARPLTSCSGCGRDTMDWRVES
jgi:hypothetical protein